MQCNSVFAQIRYFTASLRPADATTLSSEGVSVLRKRFGRLLAAHRKRRGLRQADLAEAVGLSVDQLAKLESGTSGASFDGIERLAEALQIDVAELFSAQMPGQLYERRAFSELSAELASLSDADLRWVTEIVRAALRPRR